MKIYTSYYAKANEIKSKMALVSISRSMPRDFDGWEIKALAPSWETLNGYKRDGNKELYTKRYAKECLLGNEQKNLVLTLQKIANAENKESVCMFCYERPGEFCHRHIVADWLKQAGFEVDEY